MIASTAIHAKRQTDRSCINAVLVDDEVMVMAMSMAMVIVLDCLVMNKQSLTVIIIIISI